MGGAKQNPSVRGVWIFSGTVQLLFQQVQIVHWAINPGTKLVGMEFALREKMKNIINGLSSHLPRNLEFGHFMLSFCTGR